MPCKPKRKTVLRLLGPTLHGLTRPRVRERRSTPKNLPFVAEELAVARAALERLIEAARLVA